jgi:hypothetical protein
MEKDVLQHKTTPGEFRAKTLLSVRERIGTGTEQEERRQGSSLNDSTGKRQRPMRVPPDEFTKRVTATAMQHPDRTSQRPGKTVEGRIQQTVSL